MYQLAPVSLTRVPTSPCPLYVDQLAFVSHIRVPNMPASVKLTRLPQERSVVERWRLGWIGWSLGSRCDFYDSDAGFNRRRRGRFRGAFRVRSFIALPEKLPLQFPPQSRNRDSRANSRIEVETWRDEGMPRARSFQCLKISKAFFSLSLGAFAHNR